MDSSQRSINVCCIPVPLIHPTNRILTVYSSEPIIVVIGSIIWVAEGNLITPKKALSC